MNGVTEARSDSAALATLVCQYEIAADAVLQADAAMALAVTNARGCLQRLLDQVQVHGAMPVNIGGVRKVLILNSRAEHCRIVPLVEVAQ